MIRNLVALCIAIVVSLLLGEVAIRIAAPQQLIIPNHQLWRPDPETGWRHVENTRTQINTGEGTVHFVTDAEGYRIDTIPAPEPPDRAFRILVIGDSFVEATAVEQRNAFPAVLEQRLNAIGTPTVVVNDGVGAWDPNQYLKETSIALSRHKYDLGIVCLYVGNDILSTRVSEFSPQVVSKRPSFRWPHSMSRSEWIDALIYPLNDWLEQRSHLFVFVKSRLGNLLSRLGLSSAYFPEIFRISEAHSECWAVTAAICQDVAKQFAEKKTPVLFILLPTRYQVTRSQFEDYVHLFDIPPDSVDALQPNRLLSAAFAADSLSLLDPLVYFSQYREPHPPLYGQVDGHLSGAGHVAVADFLVPWALEVVGQREQAARAASKSP